MVAKRIVKVQNDGDLRVRRTREAIRSSFVEMLLKMPYEKVTVTELSHRASINKKTFYRHYAVLDDLLEEVESEFIHPYVELTSGLRYPDDAEAIIREFLFYSSQQGPLYDAFITNDMHKDIMTKMMDDMGAERSRAVKPPLGWNYEEWSLYLNYVNSAQVRVYRQWVMDGRLVPVSRMVAIGVRLICSGANMENGWRRDAPIQFT